MRPSSSPSDAQQPPGHQPSLLGPLFGADEADDAIGDASFLHALLDVEAALARAGAAAGLLPGATAEVIAAACSPDAYDIADLARRSLDAGNPVAPLVRDISARVPADAAPFVHLAATSQDILDTALSLVAHRALGVILDSLAGLAEECARLTAAHRDTMVAGRTLLQHALPTTFGRKTAEWLSAVDAARLGLIEVREKRLAIQLGGAVGTLASLGDAGPDVIRHLAAHLGLTEPVLPWHTDRTRFAELAAALGVAGGVLGKIALDVVLLSQSEIAEVSFAGSADRGGSSTLPHKHNPVLAVLVRASTQRVPGLAATMFGAMAHEHERAAGAWHAEWEVLRELLRLVAGAAARTNELLSTLQVDQQRMHDNVRNLGDYMMAESVAARLAPALGRTAANQHVRTLVQQAASGGVTLRASLLADAVVRAHLDASTIDVALDPARYLGSAGVFADRALAAHKSVAARTRRSEEAS